jgi:mRNA interferase MazF
VKILRGEVWNVDLNPVQGNEQAGYRPALIISINDMNDSPQNLVYAIPITSKQRALRSRIPIKAGEAKLAADSYIICEKMRSISHSRLKNKRGMVSEQTMASVERVLGVLLGIIKAPPVR